jgi:hypothetical protein
MYGTGIHLAGAPGMSGGGSYGSLPNAFYGAILPVILDALNLPADKKTLQRILDIAAVDYEKTKDKDRLVELVVEDYVKMLMGQSGGRYSLDGRMTGTGLRLAGRGKAPVIRKYIKSALVKSMSDLRRDGVLTGSGIVKTFSKVVNAVKPLIKPAVKVGKFLWKNREAIENVALKATPFLML